MVCPDASTISGTLLAMMGIRIDPKALNPSTRTSTLCLFLACWGYWDLFSSQPMARGLWRFLGAAWSRRARRLTVYGLGGLVVQGLGFGGLAA